MNKKKSLLLLLLINLFIFNKNAAGSTNTPSLDFGNIQEMFGNTTSIHVLQLNICSCVMDCAYALLLEKQFIGNAMVINDYRVILQSVKNKPRVTFLLTPIQSTIMGLGYTAVPAGMNYFLENLYSVFFENNYWKQTAISYTTHMSSSLLFTLFHAYKAQSEILATYKASTHAMIFIFMFQNYGAIAVFTSVYIADLLEFCRMRCTGW